MRWTLAARPAITRVVSIHLEQALRGNLTQRRLMEDLELRGWVGNFGLNSLTSRPAIRFR